MTKQVRIVVLTGAGISAESGIRTFRATDGLWENHPVDEVATQKALLATPNSCSAFTMNAVSSYFLIRLHPMLPISP